MVLVFFVLALQWTGSLSRVFLAFHPMTAESLNRINRRHWVVGNVLWDKQNLIGSSLLCFAGCSFFLFSDKYSNHTSVCVCLLLRTVDVKCCIGLKAT